jgi:uncharacterized membrane protein YkoI
MRLQRFSVLAALLLGSAAMVANSEQLPSSPAPPPAPVAAVLSASGVSMDQAVKMAEQHFHARVVRAETEHPNGRTVYVLRLLNDSGRVWIVRVDAANGELL